MPDTLAGRADFFRREGFMVVRGVLDREELAALDAELDRLARSVDALPTIREGFQLEQRQDAGRGRPAFRKIGGITDLSEPFARLLRHPRLLPLLHAIVGPRVQLYRDVCMMKPARVGREKPWHQDSVYWPWAPMELVSAMTALDDAGPENGCLQVIPRTHLVQRQHYGEELQLDLDDVEQARTRYVPLAAGDTLLFHSLLLHASEPNHSERDRRVCIFSYKPPELEFIGRGNRPEPILVSEITDPRVADF
ncbi:MAG: hypothetical protein BIFFINMI_01824 [Phycisphaerae bacterium]|nr:hypothetical protein [Phycisphaerae bacterium]